MEKALIQKFRLSDLISCEVSKKGVYNEILAMAIKYIQDPEPADQFESSIGDIVFFKEKFENFEVITIAHNLEVKIYLKNLI